MAKKEPPTSSTRRIEYRPLDDIRDNPANPKGHALTDINDSVERFGYIDGVAIDERTGYLISGHGRTKTLRAMHARGDAPPDGIQVAEDGTWLVPVQVGWASRDDTEAAGALIALNRTTELGGWVDESLLDLLDDLSDGGNDMAGLLGVGFKGEELEELRGRLNALDEEPVPGGGTSGDGGGASFAPKDLPGVRDLVTLHHGDCIDVLKTLPDASVDAVVTDPPYGLEFMGKEWDAPWKAAGAVIHDPATERGGFQDGNGGNPYSRSRIEYGRGGEASVGFQEWCGLWAAECLRVLKPGGHMLAFGGSRTWHRLAAAVEDAGFEIRDSIAWLYGSGFPKSLDVSKAIDKAAGAEREVVGRRTTGIGTGRGAVAYIADSDNRDLTAPATEDAQRWDGWGTALKPAFEPIVVGRKPLDGTVAANVLTYGTGALNIDGCRVAASDGGSRVSAVRSPEGINKVYGRDLSKPGPVEYETPAAGRWPSNVVLDESQAEELDRQSGFSTSPESRPRTPDGPAQATFALGRTGGVQIGHGDSGGASRFFPTFRYEAKAPTSERPREDDVAHPTVKPVDLMRWLVRLVTPPGGVVLEPFAGSGTTLEAAVLEGFACIGIEREASYLPLIRQRLGLSGDAEL